MQQIRPLSTVCRDYVTAFDLSAVATAATGRIFLSQNPAKATSAYWCTAGEARRVARVAKESGDIVGAAKELHVHLTPHERLIERTVARTARIEQVLETATHEGWLKFFNAEYRKRRLAARRNGKRFMSYECASRKLRQAIARCLANGGIISPALVTQVFE
jgi:hypothetical protein